jgi:putative toxin-antitoxin system antitoxin component (TIGR02293 family)
MVDQDESAGRLARVTATAEQVWNDREDAETWLAKPHAELGNLSPLEVAKTEAGARRVEELLGRLFFGVYG